MGFYTDSCWLLPLKNLAGATLSSLSIFEKSVMASKMTAQHQISHEITQFRQCQLQLPLVLKLEVITY